MRKVHEGVCGTHLSGISLARKFMRQGYFWMQMEGDCVQYVRHCKACQYHDNKSHLPAVELHPMTPSWPFSAWGIDVIGKKTSSAKSQRRQALNGRHQYILVAVDYLLLDGLRLVLQNLNRQTCG
ncbi:uncharacterized protein LOC119370997 [Jatropha curcas]|uniref:uncharacterized protein LOC119370997 n=1 Tax=Jatropha curcas TaxID=180498 RepID=UPI001894CCF9|nr:uncharacterized protein LOC119370997 [Jatropha curcas]